MNLYSRYSWIKLKEKLRRKISGILPNNQDEMAKIIDTKFGMRITYQMTTGRNKGHVFTEFYSSFDDIGDVRKELIKWVFVRGGSAT